MKLAISRLAGAAICILLALLGEWIVGLLGMPIPGGVLGFFLLLGLFALWPAFSEYMAAGSALFLNNLLLFFIPAVMSIIAHPEFFGFLGLKLLIVLVTGTAFMMVSVGLSSQWLLRRFAPRGNRLKR